MMLQTCTSLQEWRATETRTLSRSWPKKRLRISCNRNANCCRLLPLFPPSRLHRLLRFSKHLRSLPLHQSLPSSRTWQEHPLTQSTVRSLRSLPPLTREATRTQAPVIAPVSFSYEYDYYSTPAPSPVFIGSATATPVSSDTPVSAPPVRHKVPSSKHKAPAGAPYPGAKHPAKAPKQPKTNSPSKGPASTSPSPKTSSQTKPLPPTAAVPSSVTAAETTNATMPPPPNSVVAPVPSVLLGALVILVQVIILVV